MVEVTELAAGELKSLLEQKRKADHALRIFVAGIGCSGIQYGLKLDNMKNEDDVELRSNGIKLFIDQNIQKSLDGVKIDFIDNEYGKGFIIKNPNAPECRSGCSC